MKAKQTQPFNSIHYVVTIGIFLLAGGALYIYAHYGAWLPLAFITSLLLVLLLILFLPLILKR